MKIGIEVSFFAGCGGIVNGVQYLINACKKYYPEIEIVTFSSRRDLKSDFGFYNKRYYYSVPFGLNLKELKAKLSDCDYLLFACNGQYASMFSEFKHKNISIIHDVLPLEIPNYFKADKVKAAYIEETQANINASKIIYTSSEYSKKQILSNFDCKIPIVIIPWGITLPDIKKETHKNTDGSYFIFNGGYHYRKGIVPFLKASLLAHERGNFHSKIVFTGKQKYFSLELVKLILKAKNRKILKEYGFIDDIKLANLIKNARALVYPSKYEGFGLPLLEGMSLNCPVIAARGTCIEEISEGACAFADIDNISSFADTLVRVEQDEAFRNELIKKGQVVASKYNWFDASKVFMENLVL